MAAVLIRGDCLQMGRELVEGAAVLTGEFKVEAEA